jgi:transcriptional regulator with XRE-family HTH domain
MVGHGKVRVVRELMTECRDPRSVRRDLGRRLAAARQAAGLTQRQLAEAVRYSRSTVSNAEIGHPDVARLFWTRCDRVLHAGQAFTPAFDQLKAAERMAARPPGDRAQAFRQARQAVSSAGLAAALTGYRDLGWPAEAAGERADLLTGDVIDALEVPRHWGMLAASLWRLSQGRCDLVRCLPALPRPARALAVIAAGHRWYFLAAAGGCPWAGAEPAPGEALPGQALRTDDLRTDDLRSDDLRSDDLRSDDLPGNGLPGGQAIRWHARGGRIPAPPSRLPRDQAATWAYLPAQVPRLAPAIGLVGLLAAAAAMAGPESAALTLPGGARVVPASGWSPAAARAGATT